MVAQVEVPDGYRVVTLVGQESGGTPQIVQLDGAGRIVAVIQGEIEGITDHITVDQSSAVRQIQGTDGSTLKTVKLDANGQLIMVPRGQSGNYMSVDASGFLTSVMKGDYTGTPTTLAVDSSGNIVAVIKGEYSGSLKTLATDADGRLQIVPYDPDDIWGNAIGTGNAEVIASLTPAKRYDRRGAVAFWDDFEQGLSPWYTQASAGGGYVSLSSVRSHHGTYSVRLHAAGTLSQFARILKGLPRNVGGNLGLETAFCWVDTIDYVYIGIYWTTGSVAYSAQVRWEGTGTSFEYLNNAAGYTDIDASKSLLLDLRYWHIFKLVVDTDNNKYVRAFLDNEEYSLANISVYSAVSATAPSVYVDVWADAPAAGAVDVWADSVVFTQAEPA